MAPLSHAARPGVTTPWLGVTYIDRTESSPRAIHLHVAQIDLGAPGIRFKLSPHAGPLEVVRQTTLEFLKEEHAQVAVNAHFFWPWPSAEPNSQVLGIAASDGTIYSAFESPEQSFALLPDAPGLNIDRTNHAAIVHDDRSQSDGRHTIERALLWTTVAGSAQIVTNGVTTIPRYKDAAHPDAALTPGGPSNFSNAHSWYDAVTARTAIGLSKDARTVTLFTVDVRGGSLGMSVGEVAAVLIREFDAWNALNLDGGGSTSMALEDPVSHEARLVNASSDNPAGRSVGSSLAVFARARDPR
jgi:exopolysaccharide biosynthesis protein